MSSDATIKGDQGHTTLVVAPNNNNMDELGGQDPPPDPTLDDLDVFVDSHHPDTCQACKVKDDELRLITEQFTEKEEEISNLTHSLRAKHAELDSFKKEHEAFVHGKHELNYLRALVVNVTNLGVPVTDHFGPDQIFMDRIKPSPTKAFNSPLAKVPSGAWGNIRSIQVDSAESKEIVPQLVSSTTENYYIATAFSDYRQLFAQFLDSAKLFQCAGCLRPLYKQQRWILCMRCLAVPYCSTTCIQGHKPLHGIGCKTHRVWMADIEPLRPTTATYPPSTSISTSTSSSSSDGRGGKGKGKGKGQHDQPGSHKRQRTDNSNPICWHYTNNGKCNKGDSCPKDHDNEARQRHLEKELARLSSSKVVQQTGAYGGYDGDYGADGEADGDTWI